MLNSTTVKVNAFKNLYFCSIKMLIYFERSRARSISQLIGKTQTKQNTDFCVFLIKSFLLHKIR